ncbi:MAG TPA: hypothetical protein ENN08_03865 [Bacteroidales bacterium]|nr:hypothetical protein [Bacteroidales bacterium]
MKENANIFLLRIFWVFLLILNIFMIALVMPQGTERILSAADNPESASLLDVQVFGFDKTKAWSILNAMGEDGRRQYAVFAMREDLVFPLAYGLFCGVTLFSLAVKRFRAKFPVMLIFPALAVFADFAENFFIVLLIRQFPELLNSTMQFASLANMIKWGSVALSLGLMAAFLVLLVIQGKTRQRTLR